MGVKGSGLGRGAFGQRPSVFKCARLPGLAVLLALIAARCDFCVVQVVKKFLTNATAIPAAADFNASGVYLVLSCIVVRTSDHAACPQRHRLGFDADLGVVWVLVFVLSLAGRAYPDIAALGHNYYVELGGSPNAVDGTSCSTPVIGGE